VATPWQAKFLLLLSVPDGPSPVASQDAVLYLTEAATVTGHILYVDGGSHFGRW
jgi:hypothetical protein